MKRALLAAMLLWWSSAGADDLGRLFTTAQERAQLTQGIAGSAAPAASPVQSGATVQGVVRRSGGTAVVWLNGKPLMQGQSLDGTKLLDVNRHRAIILPNRGEKPVVLKPGQRLSEEGRVLDTFESTATNERNTRP